MYWTKDNEKQVSHKYYRLHEDRRRFELGLRFYRSSFSYLSVDRKTDINMQILKRGHNLLLRKTSICPPYWNANSKTLEPSLLQAPEDVDSAVICAFPWQGSYNHIYLLSVSGLIFNFWLSGSENQQLREETKLLHGPAWEKNARRG